MLTRMVGFVTTTSPERAKAFYGDTLGLKQSKQCGEMKGQEYETGNLTIAIMESEAFGRPFAPNTAGIAVQVPDVQAAREELEAAGVEFPMDTLDSGVCHMAFFNDPDGNALILHHRYAPKDAAPPTA